MRSYSLSTFSLAILVFLLFSACHDNTAEPKNEPPLQPSLVTPESEETYVSLDTELIWSCTDPDNDTLFYDVYFGTSTNPPIVVESTRENSYTPDTLLSYTTYYWKVVARDQSGEESESDTWSFTTTYHAGYEKAFPLGDTGLMHEMVWIPPGSFMMGGLDFDEWTEDDEFPRHEVNISEGFWMGKYEVTNKEYRAICFGEIDTTMHQNRPVFLQQLFWIYGLVMENLNASEESESWSLPSEAEWEYACRAGNSDSIYWWGNNYDELSAYAWFHDNSQNRIYDVGMLQPNPWNLYDILGHIYELCEDDYHSSYEGAPTDGSSWIETPRGEFLVIRGGNYRAIAENITPSDRISAYRFESYVPTGFRLKKKL